MARILLIEDDNQVMTLLRKVIGTLQGDIEVIDVANAYDAIDWVKTRPPDIIVLDVLLARATNANGFMVYFQHLVRAGAVPDIPVLLVSGMPKKQLEGLKAAYPSIKAIFQKPFEIDELRDSIQDLLPEQPVERACTARL